LCHYKKKLEKYNKEIEEEFKGTQIKKKQKVTDSKDDSSMRMKSDKQQ